MKGSSELAWASLGKFRSLVFALLLLTFIAILARPSPAASWPAI